MGICCPPPFKAEGTVTRISGAVDAGSGGFCPPLTTGSVVAAERLVFVVEIFGIAPPVFETIGGVVVVIGA